MKFYVRLIMRINLTCILLFSVLLQVSASGLAQNVSISKKNISLQQLFVVIKAQTGYDFLYEPQMLYFSKPISLDVSNASIKEVLDKAFANEKLTYTIDQKTIVVKKAAEPLVFKILAYFASFDIQGRVADEKGAPLIGVTVRIKGSPRLVLTNARGEFELKKVDEKTVLQISSVGYKPKELKATQYMNIVLELNSSQLDSVTVVMSTGYQNLNKERSTGSAVVVTREELNRKPNGNIIDRIADIVPGFMKTNRKEQFSVRGISSINGNKQPLIVLDDFPYPGDQASINRINPNDVESVTVLKDAAAASIWGAQAGNGVIVITTRKGKYNKAPQVSFNTNVTISGKPDLFSIPTMTSKDVLDFERFRFNRGDFNTYDDDYPKFKNFGTVLTPGVEVMLAARSGKITKEQADAQLARFENHDVRNDINKYFLQNSVNQQYSFNISGGGSNYNYYASLGYDKNTGNAVTQSDDRLSINYNNSYKPIKNLEINAFIGFTRSKSNIPRTYGTTFLPTGGGTAPYTMLADENGHALAIPKGLRLAYVDTAKAPALLDWHYRPLDELNNGSKTNKVDLFRIGGSAKYTVIPGLTADVRYQYQSAITNNKDYKNINSFEARDKINNFMYYNPTKKAMEYPVPLGGIIDFGNIESISWNIRGSLNFNRRFGSHEFVAIAGSEIRQNTDESRFSSVYGFNEDLYTVKAINPDVIYPTRFGSSVIGGGNSISGSIGRYGDYFGNAAYTFRDKYTVSASARIDQSNFYGLKANMRKAPLWSGGLAWNVFKEDFFHVDWLSSLRLRTTYGYNGNTNGGTAYPIERYSGNNLAGAQYADLTSPGNPELRWEKVKIVNFAVEASSKNGRINGNFEYYLKNGIDLISAINLDPTTGVFNFIGNKATIKAHGYDFNVNTSNLVGAFKWNTSFILSYNIDKVVAYDQKVSRTSLYTADEVPVIGKPLYKISSYRWAGLSPIDGTPQVYLGDTVSSYKNIPNAKESDLVYNGSTTPRYAGSIINTFGYKDFSISVNINFRFNYVFRRSTIDYGGLFSGAGGHIDYEKRWQKPGDELFTDVPSLPANSGAISEAFRTAQFTSDNLVEKGDHIRFQDVRFAYNLSKSKLHSLPFQNVQFYAYASNLGVIWRANKSGLDPDAASFGAMKAPKSFAFGLNVNF